VPSADNYNHKNNHNRFLSPKTHYHRVRCRLIWRSCLFRMNFCPSFSLSPSLPLPLELGPLDPAKGVCGSAVRSPSGVRGGAPATNAFVGHFERRKRVWWQQNCFFLFICCAKVLRNRTKNVIKDRCLRGGIFLPWLIYQAVCLIPPLSRRPCNCLFPMNFQDATWFLLLTLPSWYAVCRSGSIWNGTVSACLSVCPSMGRQQQNCSGFAAASPADSRDRWIAEGSLQSDQ